MEKELRPGRRTSASLLGKISVVVLKTLAALVLIALLAVFVTSVSPIYDFAEPRPFSGPDIFNPYRDGGDSAFCWKRANFHTHTRVKGILNECEHWPDETDAAYRKFGYDIVTFSNHNELTVHPYDPLLQVNVYEHGYNLFKYHKLVFGCSDVNLFDHLVPLFASQKQFQLDLLGKESDFIQMNHPLRTIGTSEDHMRKLGGYRIMELDSGKSKENEYWDWALSAGHYSFGLANDDLHFPDRSSAIAVRCNFLCCPSARYEDIRKTLLGGCYYAMRVPDYGRGDWEVKYERNRHLPSIERIGLDGQTVYIALSCPADSIKVTGQDHATLAVALINMQNWPWIDRHAPKIGSLIMPWSYVVNSVRYYNSERKRNRKEIPLPDARIATDSRDVCVLVIGESARRANFSLYGYGRPTNPLLERDSVTALMADAAATYTTAGVKAILDHKPTNKLYEILPNYLYRNGVDVVWRSANWGEPPLHIDKHYGTRELKARYPEADDRYDGILLAGLRDEILSSDKDKLLIVLHTSTSHGPTYYKKYPAGFEVFKPVCTTVEMSKADPGELMNAYDNTIVYTDYLIHSVIEILRDVPRRSCLIFVSDHGESLGEGNLYMHGVPMLVAPKEQIEIPFLVWTSDGELKADAGKQVGQYHVFHSILRFLGIDSPVYDESLDIFSPTEKE